MYLLAKIFKKVQIPAIKNSSIDSSSKVASAAHIVDTTMGKYSYVGNYSTVIDADIGNFCSIADNVIIGGASHPLEWVSTSPVFQKGKNILKKNFFNHPFETTSRTVVKNDVWIGSNCLIKSGITIGSGAVIGMGSIVTKDVKAYEIWAGNPARFIRKRFDDETIERLLDSRWWDWDDSRIKKHSDLMNNIEEFIKKISSSNKNL
ncbi:MAG: CatB-related O-acetyltransferase [Ghiorsea sp.]|nr:CatB-related O-acetyltransferase [Ghiorsea sp.]